MSDTAREVIATGAAALAEPAGPAASFGAYWGAKAATHGLDRLADKYGRDYNNALRESNGNTAYAHKMAELQNGWFSDGNSYM